MPKIILVKTSDLKESDIASLSFARLEKGNRYPRAKGKDVAFTRIRAYKESFIKALEMGLAMSLSSFGVVPTSKGIILKQTAEARNWAIEEIKIEGYIASICKLDQ